MPPVIITIDTNTGPLDPKRLLALFIVMECIFISGYIIKALRYNNHKDAGDSFLHYMFLSEFDMLTMSFATVNGMAVIFKLADLVLNIL